MSVITPIILGSTLAIFQKLQKKKSEEMDDKNELTSCKQKKQNILKQRTFDGLTKETKDLIELITLQNGVFPVGSFKYKAHRYPGDIDIFEQVRACCDSESASNEIAKRISEMAKEIKTHNDIYLGDFKAGLDHRYDVSTVTELEDLNKQGLLTNSQLDEAINSLNKSNDDLNEYLRQFKIVRWNLDELINGSKTLPKNKNITLAEALTHKSVVKIDLWAPLNGNYNEITNFLLIIAKDKNGNETVLNEELGDRLKNLNHDIAKYGSAKYRNSLKLAKRIWNISLFINDNDMIKKLYPLFQSGANSLNQIAGESEVLRMMVEKLKNPPMDVILTQIDGFRRRITDVYDVDFDPTQMYNIIIDILNKKVDIIDGLEKLEAMIKKVVEIHAKDFLECNISDLDNIIKNATKLENEFKKEDEVLEDIND